MSYNLQEVFLIEIVEESATILHVFTWSSSIAIIIEMPDFDCLHRQFQTRLSHLLRQAARGRRGKYQGCGRCAATSNPLRWQSAACRPSSHNRMRAAERREATLMCKLSVQSRAGQPQATRSGLFTELHRAPLSCHRSQSAADALRCLPPARH